MREPICIMGDSQIHALRKGAREEQSRALFKIDFIAPGRLIRAFDPGRSDAASTAVRGAFFTKIHGGRGPIAISFGGGEHARTWSYQRNTSWSIKEEQNGACVVTEGLLEAYFYSIFQPFYEFVSSQTHARDVPCAVLSFPPIIRDGEKLLKFRNAIAAKSGAMGVASESDISSPHLRLSTWQILEEVKRQLCLQYNLYYLPAPEASFDERGFIRDLYIEDAFHANHAYGVLVLKKLIAWRDEVIK